MARAARKKVRGAFAVAARAGSSSERGADRRREQQGHSLSPGARSKRRSGAVRHLSVGGALRPP
jgi:hypothetical protein